MANQNTLKSRLIHNGLYFGLMTSYYFLREDQFEKLIRRLSFSRKTYCQQFVLAAYLKRGRFSELDCLLKWRLHYYAKYMLYGWSYGSTQTRLEKQGPGVWKDSSDYSERMFDAWCQEQTQNTTVTPK